METKAGEIRMGKAEGKREEIKEERKKETTKQKNNRSKEDGRDIEGLGLRKSSEIGERGKSAGTRKIPQVDSYFWQENQ